MGPVELIVLLAVAVGAAGAARKVGLSPPLLLVVLGLGMSLLPIVPTTVLDPEVVLLLVLPPLLYSAALESSFVGIRANLRPIALLSVGLVLFTTVLVGQTVVWLVPDMPVPVAYALGAIVAPPDAVAATAVGRTLGLPRRVVTILGGESLLNDATALTAYRLAVAAAVGQMVTMWDGLLMFAWSVVGGVALGLVLGAFLDLLLRRLRDSVLENAANLITPFIAFALGEALHTSGVLAVVAAGLYVAHRGSRSLSFSTRLQMESVWQVLSFVLESLVFLLIGLQLPGVVQGLDDIGIDNVATVSGVVLAVVILARPLWIFPASFLPRLVPRVARREPRPSPRAVAVLSWCGMRGVVSLAAAFGLPLTVDSGQPFPYRDLVVFLTFVVVIGTLVIQGLTLPWLIRRMKVVGTDPKADVLAEAQAVQSATAAGLERLEQIVDEEAGLPPATVEQLRSRAQRHADGVWERLGRQDREPPTATYRRLRREMIDAERVQLERLRNDGQLDDEVFREAQRELDYEEALLTRG